MTRWPTIRRRCRQAPDGVRPEGVPPVLDEAHVGDIRGALGTIACTTPGERHGWRSRLMALLAIMGPGLIVMVGDNDAGGVSTYSQAGQNYGTSLLWVLVLLVPVLIVNQEMVIRLGRGHRRRPRAPDLRALRQVLGRVLGRRPVPAELPDDRHGVHRREPRARLLRREQVPRGADRRGDARGDHLHRQLPQLGALHVRVRGRQLPRHPAADPRPPRRRRGRPSSRSSPAWPAARARARCC